MTDNPRRRARPLPLEPPALPVPPPETGLTPEDVARARLAWRQAATPAMRDLLDAETEDRQ